MGDRRQPGRDGGAAPRAEAVRYDEVRLSEVVVVGTGVAGLAAALGCSPRSVTVLTKGRLGKGGSSAWAQGGVAVAVGEDDDPQLHAADTLSVSGGLGDPEIVGLLTREGPLRIRELIALGARFDQRQGREASDGESRRSPARSLAADSREPVSRHRRSGRATRAEADVRDLALGREAAHSRRRILHAGGDATGAELVRALVESVRRAPGVTVEEDSFAVDLVVEGGGSSSSSSSGSRVVGVLALDRHGRRILHLAGAVVLATGGLGQLFRYTTNPVEVTGDGLAMAARAGARLVDVEMVQFHPTALAAGEADGALPLLTEALRGEGAVLVDGDGRRFMPDEHPDAELAPRDVVARAIHRRREAGIPVYLDARAAVGDRFPERFPTVFAKATAAGLDPRREPLPVTAAAHYHMGGVEVDERGRSTLPGLWACGEAACTGAHGANRLASNSLLEALVFGARVADDLALRLAGLPGTAPAALARLRAAGRPLAGRQLEGPPHPTSTDPSSLHADEEGIQGSSAPQPTSAEEPTGGRRLEVRGLARLDASAASALHASLRTLRDRLRRTLWSRVGLLRDAPGLHAALAALDGYEAEWSELAVEAENLAAADPGRVPLRVELAEVHNLLTAGRLVATAALARPESRGAHQREDFPVEDPAWRRRLHLQWLAPVAASTAAPAPRIRLFVGPLLEPARGSRGAGGGQDSGARAAQGQASGGEAASAAAAVFGGRYNGLTSPLGPPLAAGGRHTPGPEAAP